MSVTVINTVSDSITRLWGGQQQQEPMQREDVDV
jgi:hypothetical protein